MPQPPYAKVRASINGGAIQTGGLTIAASSTVQLSADPGGAVGISQYLWEIYDFPPTYAQPTGWFTDANGVYYSTAPTPPVFTVGATSIFGKYMIRLTANGGVSPNPKVKPPSDLVDEFTSVEVLALSGIHDIGFNETNQWSSFKSWLYHLKADLRIIDTAINGGFSGGGVTAHGALTGLSNDDHTQYLRTDGTRALTGNWSAGSHKITSLLDPTSAQDAATKAYVDSVVPVVTGVIRANGSVAFTGAQSMGGFKLTALGTPTVSTDAATKGYVDLQIIPAGTNPFTGPQSMGGFKLTNVATPTVSSDAATKAYADAAAAATIVPAGTNAFTGNQSMGGFKLTNLGTPTLSTDAVTKAYADAIAAASGVTAHSALTGLSADDHTQYLRTDGTRALTGDQSAGGHKITNLATPAASTDACTKGYADSQIIPAGTNAFTGNQSMGGFKLTNVGAPTVSTDAATKGYVDALGVPSATLGNADVTITPGLGAAFYTLPAATLTGNHTVTIGTTGTGLVDGFVCIVKRSDRTANTLAIVNGGSNSTTMFTFGGSPLSDSQIILKWNGIDWVYLGFQPLI